MRLILSALFAVSLLLSLAAQISAREKDADKEKRIAEIKKEIAELRARIATLEARLAELQPPLDLLALVDLKQDTVAGEWTWKDKRLVSPGTGDARVQFPVRPGGDYQLTVKFKRPQDGGGPILCLPVGDKHVNFALDAYAGEFTALEAIDDAYVNSPANPSQIKGKHVVTDKSHSLEATVRMKEGMATIAVDLDGKRLLEWTGNPNRFSLHPAWRLKDDRHVGLRSWQPFEFEAVQLRMLTGEANLTRKSGPAPK
jgi:hypothetical protein